MSFSLLALSEEWDFKHLGKWYCSKYVHEIKFYVEIKHFGKVNIRRNCEIMGSSRSMMCFELFFHDEMLCANEENAEYPPYFTSPTEPSTSNFWLITTEIDPAEPSF